MTMPDRSLIRAVTLAAALICMSSGARAFDETKYPDLTGQWVRIGPGQYDPAKPPGRGQQPPFTAEYQAKFEASLADQANGGQGSDPTYRCIPSGMPRAMIVIQPMEIVVTADTTYMMIELFGMLRRVYTDGRAWPQNVEPQFMGYSIGRWVGQDRNGRFEALEIETRHIKGPHSYDASGAPLHEDGEAVVKERISLDQSNPDILHDEITTIDHALTRPWTVTRSARRERDKSKIVWSEYVCSEDNHHVIIGKENYLLTGDGYLMPARKGQPGPDLKYFK
jgi:hypothetical protein